jgi:hypothetical protein
MALNKLDILNCNDVSSVAVEVPEWGGTVHVRQLTAGERDAWETFVSKNPGIVRASLAAFVVADENGNLLFSEQDIPALAKKNGKALDRIFEVAAEHNRLRKEDVDELEKN